jgi:helicase MOV-10
MFVTAFLLPAHSAKGYDLELSLALGAYYPSPRLRQLLSILQGANVFTAPKEVAEIK